MASAAGPAPPAIGGVRAPTGRIRCSSIASPAHPPTNPTPISTINQIRYRPSIVVLNLVELVWTIEIPFERTSTKMNARIPTANIASADPRPAPEQLEPPDGKAQEDREPRECSEGDGFGKGHCLRRVRGP